MASDCDPYRWGMTSRSFRTFLNEQESIDGAPPLSEAKEAMLGDPHQVMVIAEDDDIVALGVVKLYQTSEDVQRAAFETVVPRSMRFPAFEDRVVDETLALIPSGISYTGWSRRSSLDAALERRGMSPVRSLAEMSMPLSVASLGSSSDPVQGDSIAVRSFTTTDADALIDINRAAFGDHPEAASLDRKELNDLMQKAWFDPQGVLFHESDGEVAGFCWTKVHPEGEGEIYRVGVDPRHRGKGIGRRLTLAGYRYLAEARGCTTGFLWVDEANTDAVGMYEGIGLVVRSRNREFGHVSPDHANSDD